MHRIEISKLFGEFVFKYEIARDESEMCMRSDKSIWI